MIKFGTSGWRGIMGDEFTFQNVRIVIQAVANYLEKKYPKENLSVVMNYDTRFLSERFAFEAAKILSHNKIHVLLANRDAPSQAQALQIILRKAHAGINFTASFNPPEYNGLKFNNETGAPALPDTTDEIENEIKILKKDYTFSPCYPDFDYIEKIDLQQDYLFFIQERIDFDTIRKSGIKVAVDLLYGTSREYLDEVLEENQIPVEEIHGYIDPYFGGITPSCSQENLGELCSLIKEKNCQLGIATDADGDRFGIMDEKGKFIEQNIILSLILDYILSKKDWRGGIARSVSTTHLIDRIARQYDLPLYKTPVGFKYLADLFLQGKIIFGGEESACLVIKDHLPEKDGIIAGLLVAEMMASEEMSLSGLIKKMFTKYGKRIGSHKDVVCTTEREKKLKKLIKDPPRVFSDRKVLHVETIDGIKLDFSDDDWFLYRFSGTMPVIRCYAESDSEKKLNDLIKFGLEKLS
jgi:phosphoglucomutase